jgi:hypothetical protein
MDWPTSCPMHFPHVPDKNSLACEAQLQGVLESENHYHKLQLPHELHAVELGRTTSKL